VPPLTFRSMPEAVAAMLRIYWARTGVQPDVTEGSILRTLFEAWGYEIEQQTARYDAALLDAIPEAVFAAYGFAKQPATNASVTLRFSRSSTSGTPFPIPAGTTAETITGVPFTTTTDVTLAAGTLTVDALATAVVGGSGGNVPAGSITRLVGLVPGVEAVTNPLSAFGGVDAETLSAQQERFAAYLATLAKGTAPAMAAAALTVVTNAGERAQQVIVVDNYDNALIPVGEVVVHAYRPGGTSLDLRAAILAHLELTQRPVGVLLSVEDVTPVPVEVAVTVHAAVADTANRAEETTQAFFDAIAIGEDVHASTLEAAIARADSRVYRAVVTLTGGTPASIGPYERAELDSVTVTLDTTTVT
jgi:uncharacterized phage protein gp47/JayE